MCVKSGSEDHLLFPQRWLTVAFLWQLTDCDLAKTVLELV